MLLKKEMFGLAATEFMEAGKTPQAPKAYTFAAYCFAKQQVFDLAILASDQAAAHPTNDSALLVNRAFAHMRLNHHEAAVADSESAIAANQLCMEARYIRANTRFQLVLRADANRALLPTVLEDVNLVRKYRPRSAEASQLAATAYALSARTKPAHRDLAAAAALEAVQRGAKPDRFKSDPFLKELAGHPLFEQALTAEPGERAPFFLPLRPTE